MTDDGERDIRVLTRMRALYRCYRDDGHLLYVGVTNDPGRRLGQHSEKAWFLDVHGITLEWYADDTEAAVAERNAIAIERPLYNLRRPSEAEQLRAQRQRHKEFAQRRSEAARREEGIPPQLSAPMLLDDALAVIAKPEYQIWLETIASRLARAEPQIYGGWNARMVGSSLRLLGITPHQINRKGTNRSGIYRSDLVRARKRIWAPTGDEEAG